MKRPHFARAAAIMHAIAAIMSKFAHDYGARSAAIAGIGPYKSRGPGGKKPHRSVGTKAYQRAVIKARNQRLAK